MAVAAAAALVSLWGAAAAARTVERKVLDNGLEVAVAESHASPVVSLQVWIRAGSTTEGELSGSGVSHFIEHMIFKGTAKRKVGEFDRQIRGSGGTLNAYTSTDQIVLHATVASRYWRGALSALADVVQNSSFEAAEIAKEREVIIRELTEDLDEPDRQLYRLYASTMYRVHPYRLPVGGYIEQFNALTREHVYGYYRRVFIPNNMVFVVAGDVKAEEAFAAARSEFAGFRRRPAPQVLRPREPRQTGPRRAVRRHPRARFARVRMGFRTISIAHPDLYALDVAAMVLGQGKTSRLYRRLKVAEHLAVSVGAYSHTPRDDGSFTVYAVCEEKDLPALERAALEEIDLLKTRGVSSAELSRAKNQVVAEHLRSQETAYGLAQSVGSDILVTGDPDFSSRYVEGIKGVTAREVREACRRHLDPRGLTTAAILPPAGKAAGPAPAAPPPKEAAPAELAPRRGIVKRDLPGGATLLVREARELPLVSVSAVCLGGLRLEDEGKNGLCELMARMLTRGTRRSTAAQIASRIEDIGGSLGSSGGRNSFNVSVTVPSEHLAAALDLVAECLLDARFPDDEFARAKKDLLAQVKARDERLFRAAGLLLSKSLFAGHPYSRPVLGTRKSVEPLTPSDAAGLHSRLAVPSNLVISVVGDAGAAPTEELVVKAFRLAKAVPGKVEAVSHPAAEISGQVRVAETKKGAHQTVTMIGFPGTRLGEAEQYALDYVEAILSGMGSRLWMALRDRDRQLAYAVGCYNYPQLDRGGFVFYVSTAPGKADEAAEGIFKVIGDFVRSGPTEEEMTFARRHLIGVHEIGLQSRSSVAMHIALNERYGLGAESVFDYARRIDAVKVEDVIAAARKYLNRRRCVVAVVGPEGSAGGGAKR